MATVWAIKRRIGVIIFFIIVFGLMAGLYFYKTYEPPSCFDREQNQDEDGIDCGGKICIPCADKIRDMAVLWKRFFVLNDGFVDVAVLVQNPNQFISATSLTYGIKVFDKDGVIVAVRENTTTAEPGETFLIFEPEIFTEKLESTRVSVEFRGAEWIKKEAEVMQINIVRIEPLLEDEFPRLEARIQNKAENPYGKIIVSAIIYAQDEAVGVSRTIIENLGINQERDLVFTWPRKIPNVSRAELLFRRAQ